jgi:hypothetical protein
MRIHPVFHSNLLRLDLNNALPTQHIPLPPPIVIDGENEWEVEQILDSRIRYRKLQYKAQWKNHPLDDTWYPATDFTNAPEITQAFHHKYPMKPR